MHSVFITHLANSKFFGKSGRAAALLLLLTFRIPMEMPVFWMPVSILMAIISSRLRRHITLTTAPNTKPSQGSIRPATATCGTIQQSQGNIYKFLVPRTISEIGTLLGSLHLQDQKFTADGVMLGKVAYCYLYGTLDNY